MSTMFSLRLKEDEAEMIRKYAKLNKKSVADVLRDSAIEKIEDELDLKAYTEALEEYKKDPVSYSMADMMKKYSGDEGKDGVAL